jgi:outer membrane protein assembly factor BamB/tetratricopeptide (TPR) repeat protein
VNRHHRIVRPRRTGSVRRGAVAAIAGALVAILLPAPSDRACAQDGFRGWDHIKDPGFVVDPDRREFRNYQVGRAPQVRELLEKYESLLAEHATVPALRYLQELLDDHGASVVQVANERYVGAAEYARWILLHAPADVRAAYERLAELNGRFALERARADGDDFALRSLARRYVNALVGQEALLALAHLHRERGARRVAAYHARRLLDFAASGADDSWRDEKSRTRETQIAAEARAIAALCDGSTAGLLGPGAEADAAVPVAGAAQPLARFLADTKLQPPPVAPDVWPTYGGDTARARHAIAPLRELDLGRMFELPVEHARFARERSPLAGMPHEPVQPIRVGDRLYVNNSLSVKCFDLLSRSLIWEFEGLQARVRGRDEDGFLAVNDYDPSNDYDDPTWSKALIVGASAGGDLVLANVQVPQAANVKVHQGFRINDPCRWRGLVALDAQTGALRWEQRPLVRNTVTGRLEYPELRRRGDRDAVVPRLDVPGPVAIVDDVVFALGHFFEGAINTYLIALDLESGEPLYAVPLVIGQQELSMFNMPFQEFTTGCPSFWNGTLFCSTNVGLAAAVDATFGDLRWLAAYDALKIVPPDNYFRNRPRPVYWYNRGPLVADDLVLFTPHDSMNLISLDPATGKERFSKELPRRDNRWPSSHLVGLVGRNAVVATGGFVIAVNVEDGLLTWQYPNGPRNGAPPVELLGSGVVTDREVWLPTQDEILVLDASSGEEIDRRSWSLEEPRSLLLFPDMLIAAGKTTVDVAFDPAEALRELRQQIARDGESSERLLRIGTLERQAGDYAQATKTLRRAVELSKTTLAAGDAARVRSSLCGALRDEFEQEKRAGRLAGAQAALEEAEGVADDADTRAQIVLDLLALESAGASDDRAMKWLTRMREDFANARVSIPGLSPRPVTVAIWVGLELARRHEERGELDLALVELERVQADWPAEPLAEGDSAGLAQARVDALLERAPKSLREKYDRDATTAFASAVQASDVERLALLLRRFPSASSAPEYAARELELLRANKRPVEALAVGADILRSRPHELLARSATVELARAARDVGNPSLARALVRRLGVGPEGSVPDDLRSFAESAETQPPAGSKLDPVRDLDVDDNAVVLGSSDKPVRGEPMPEGFESVLVLEPGIDMRIARIHLPDGERRWESPLPRVRLNEYTLQVLHVAGVLVAKRGSMLVALDLETGGELWRKELPLDREVVELATASGVLLFTQRTPPREGSEGEAVELTFVEPRTGRQLGAVALSGFDARVGWLIGSGPSCVVSTYGRLGQAAEVFDAVTGARQLDPHAYPAGFDVPLLLPKSELLVLPDAKPAPGELASRQAGAQRLNAWRLGGGELAFSVDLLPIAYKLRKVYAVAEGFAVLGGTQPDARVLVVDPRSGGLVGAPTPLPRDVAEAARRVQVLGDDPTRIQVFADQRGSNPMNLVALGGNGQELWRQSLEVPKNTVQTLLPDRMLRRGGVLLLALQLQAGGKYRTEVVVLDESSGTVLDRDGFDGGRPGTRDDLVRADDYVVLRQEKTLHVMGWR